MSDIWWYEEKARTFLMDGDFRVGRIQFLVTGWQAVPLWYEMSQLFETEEEAKSWLLMMYRMK